MVYILLQQKTFVGFVDIKSLNLLGNVLAKEFAVKYNATEAIQHRGETVTEGASSNVYAIKDGAIYTSYQ